MKEARIRRITFFAIASLAAILLLAGTAVAQSIQGVINGRNGATMTVQTQDMGNVVVLLTPDTQAEDVSGVFHARKKQMGVTVLVPGLQVQVQGNYNAQNQLVANTVKFNSKNLQNATDIQAGVAPVEQQTQQQQQELAQQQAKLQQEQAQIQATDAKQAKQRRKSRPSRLPSLRSTSGLASWVNTTSGMRSRFTSPTARSRLTRNITLHC